MPAGQPVLDLPVRARTLLEDDRDGALLCDQRRGFGARDGATNDGLPPFLIGNEDATDSGFMIVQYSAASLVSTMLATGYAQ